MEEYVPHCSVVVSEHRFIGDYFFPKFSNFYEYILCIACNLKDIKILCQLKIKEINIS